MFQHKSASANFVFRVALNQILRDDCSAFPPFTFNGVRNDFGLYSRLTTQKEVLTYLPSPVLAGIDELGLLHIVLGTKCSADTFIVAFKRLRDFYWSDMGRAPGSGFCRCQHADGTVTFGVTSPQ